MSKDRETIDRRQVIAAAGAIGAAALAPSVASAQAATSVAATKVHGRDAFTVSNNKLSVSVLPGGGFIGDVHLVSRDPKLNVNPMRVPEYQTMDPYAFNLERDGPKYGTGNQRQLMSGYMGHFTCFPQFGNSGAEFQATGYGQHGELVISKWERQASQTPGTLVMTAHLPLNEYNFERSITMLPDESVAYVTETAENLMAVDRPLQWVQHFTFGPPFAEVGKMWADGSIEGIRSGRGETAKIIPWPQGADAQSNPRAFSGRGNTWLMQRTKPKNWLTAYNENFSVLIGHIYDAKLNPWVLDWQSDAHSDAFPVPGKVVARGYCWGDSPGAGGIKGAVNEGKAFNVPTFSWIGPRAKRSQNYAVFMTEIPAGWRGVADISTEGGKIVITEKESGRTITLKADRT